MPTSASWPAIARRWSKAAFTAQLVSDSLRLSWGIAMTEKIGSAINFLTSLRGITSRWPFIAFVLPVKLLSDALLVTYYLTLTGVRFVIFVTLFQLLSLWPQYAITVRRLHDVGRSAIFAAHLPFYMAVWCLYLAFFYVYSRLQLLNLLPYVAYNFVVFVHLLYGTILFLILSVMKGQTRNNPYAPLHKTASEVF